MPNNPDRENVRKIVEEISDKVALTNGNPFDQFERGVLAGLVQRHWPVLSAFLSPLLADPPAEVNEDAIASLREANEVRQREWDESDVITLVYRGNELAGEVGEACNIIKKIERERIGLRGTRATIGQLGEELADVIICADLVAMKAGIDLDAEVRDKFNATSEKYGLKTRIAARLAKPQQVSEEVVRLLDEGDRLESLAMTNDCARWRSVGSLLYGPNDDDSAIAFDNFHHPAFIAFLWNNYQRISRAIRPLPSPLTKDVTDEAAKESEPSADVIGGFTQTSLNCAGCGKRLLIANAWMTDGCPCNSRLGINSMNETRWRLLMQLQQEQSRELESQPKTLNGRTVWNAVNECDRILEATLERCDPDEAGMGWILVRLTKAREALSDRPSSPAPATASETSTPGWLAPPSQSIAMPNDDRTLTPVNFGNLAGTYADKSNAFVAPVPGEEAEKRIAEEQRQHAELIARLEFAISDAEDDRKVFAEIRQRDLRLVISYFRQQSAALDAANAKIAELTKGK